MLQTLIAYNNIFLRVTFIQTLLNLEQSLKNQRGKIPFYRWKKKSIQNLSEVKKKKVISKVFRAHRTFSVVYHSIFNSWIDA